MNSNLDSRTCDVTWYITMESATKNNISCYWAVVEGFFVIAS